MYFDFAKAFDSVNHDIILQKLKQKFGIDGLLLKFMKEYLQGRTQRVSINGSLSDTLPVHSGVPQGSILGPLLFILFIDDINDMVSEGTDLVMYADDTKIYREISCDADQMTLQNDIDNLFNWSVKNKMNFHPDKCKVVPITNKKGQIPCYDSPLPFYEFWYELNGNMLEYVHKEKDLGVIINRRLSWIQHCEGLVTRANRQFGLLKRTCYFIFDQRRRRALYLSLIRSIFEHCCQVWPLKLKKLKMQLKMYRKERSNGALGSNT